MLELPNVLMTVNPTAFSGLLLKSRVTPTPNSSAEAVNAASAITEPTRTYFIKSPLLMN